MSEMVHIEGIPSFESKINTYISKLNRNNQWEMDIINKY